METIENIFHLILLVLVFVVWYFLFAWYRKQKHLTKEVAMELGWSIGVVQSADYVGLYIF